MWHRFWRLFPALITTVFASAACAALVFSPEHTIAAARAAAASALGWSNFLYWSQTGYFNADAILKPLLHTWSLSVEMQFYFIWPFIVAALGVVRRASTSVLVLASLALVILSEAWAVTDPTGAYFLLPARVFEFAVGALLIRLEHRKPPCALHLNVMIAVGAAAVLLPALVYHASMPFPGFTALVPCAGAAMLIYAARYASVGRVLSHRAMAALGRASYSIYLVHWPVIVFLAYGRPEGLSLLFTGLAILMTLVLAWLQYQLIEKNFRRPPESRRMRAATAGIKLATIAFLCGAAISGKFLWSWRYPEEIARAIDPIIAEEARRHTWPRLRASNRQFANDGRTKVLVIGDSQGGDLINMLALRYGDRIDLRSFPSSAACQILVSEEFYEAYPKQAALCLKRNAHIMEDPRIVQADVILLAFAWLPQAPKHIAQDLASLTALGAKRVIVVGPKAQAGSGMDLVASVGSVRGVEGDAFDRLPQDAVVLNEQMAAAVGASNYIDLLSLICPRPGYCHVLAEDGTPIFFDWRHLTPKGTEKLVALGAVEGLASEQSISPNRGATATPQM